MLELLSHPARRKVMKEVTMAVEQNGTLDLVQLPVYTIELNIDGLRAQVKARLMDKEYSKIMGLTTKRLLP